MSKALAALYLFSLSFSLPLYAFKLVKDENITAFTTYSWPQSKVIRHLIFEAPNNVQLDVYKQEMAFREQPDLLSRIFSLNQIPDFVLGPDLVQQALAQENAVWYRNQISEWISGVEAAESTRSWPPQMLRRIRELVLERADSVDYIVASRATATSRRNIGTLRRTSSAECFHPATGVIISPRRPLILEELFNTRLSMPYGEIQTERGHIVRGGEINEVGGLWIADGEDKALISSWMLSLLVFLIEDPRIPEPFRSHSRRWAMFTDEIGRRFFSPRYGFSPVAESRAEFTLGDKRFFVEEAKPAILKDRLTNTFDCGMTLLQAVAEAHSQWSP